MLCHFSLCRRSFLIGHISPFSLDYHVIRILYFDGCLVIIYVKGIYLIIDA